MQFKRGKKYGRRNQHGPLAVARRLKYCEWLLSRTFVVQFILDCKADPRNCENSTSTFYKKIYFNVFIQIFDVMKWLVLYDPIGSDETMNRMVLKVMILVNWDVL